jgi:peroxiredoxin
MITFGVNPINILGESTAVGIYNLTVVSDDQTHDLGMKYGFLIDGLKLLSRGVVVVGKDNKVKYVEEVSNELITMLMRSNENSNLND